MSVKVSVEYEGDLHCGLVHGPSGQRLRTDAPEDNRGRGEFFSPTDLVGASIGTCMLTIMGIAALDRGIDMTGARAEISKEMSAVPRRHISKLTVRITLPAALDEGATESGGRGPRLPGLRFAGPGHRGRSGLRLRVIRLSYGQTLSCLSRSSESCPADPAPQALSARTR